MLLDNTAWRRSIGQTDVPSSDATMLGACFTPEKR